MDDFSSETCFVLKNEFKKHRVVHQSQYENNNYYNHVLYHVMGANIMIKVLESQSMI